MPDPLIEFAAREYDYVRERSGSAFFLALAPYANALHARPRIRAALAEIESETQAALERFVGDQNAMIDEAKAIRVDLAARAPEVDNSDMDEPDHASPDRWRYEFSFARFDRLADAHTAVAFPPLPRGDKDPGPVSDLLSILRHRLKAAEYGEDAGINAQRVRDDLDDLGRRIGNLGERHRVSVQRYWQDARTLPGLAYVRVVHFGSDLVADPVQIETDDDLERFLNRSLLEFGQPRTIVRNLVNGERLDEWEERNAHETEEALKAEVERLHREIERRLHRDESLRAHVRRWAVENMTKVIVGVVTGVIVAAVIAYFGIGRGDSKSPTVPTATVPTTATNTSK